MITLTQVIRTIMEVIHILIRDPRERHDGFALAALVVIAGIARPGA